MGALTVTVRSGARRTSYPIRIGRGLAASLGRSLAALVGAYLLGRAFQRIGYDKEQAHSLVLWANELSHGKDHDFRDLPFVIAGSAGGYLKSGEYIKVTAQADTKNDADAPHNKLLTTLCNGMGVPETHFGDPGLGEPGEFDQLKV